MLQVRIEDRPEFQRISKTNIFPMVLAEHRVRVLTSITQTIISRHHGWIEVNSNRGTAVDVILPFGDIQ